MKIKNTQFILLSILLTFFSHMAIAQSVFSSISKKEKNKNLKIAVIGAGAAGISAAFRLHKKGYENITVYEKNDYVGGKVASVEYEGEMYEFGAVWVPGSYKTIQDYIKEFDIELIDAPEVKSFNLRENKQNDYFESFLKENKVIDGLKSLLATELAILTSGQFLQVGFTSKNKELNMPFSEYLNKHPKLKPVAKLLAPIISGCGYGYYSEVPTLYMFKFIKMLLDSPILSALNGKSTAISKEGYSFIFATLANLLKDVRLNSEVTSIKRKINDFGDFEIEITANGRTEVYDRVIVSTDLTMANKIMDVSPKEKKLFSKIKNYSYIVTMFEATGLGSHTTSIVKENARVETKGRTIILAESPFKKDLYQTWRLADWNMTTEELHAILKEEVEHLGGTLGNIVKEIQWSYFPHVGQKDLDNGFYDKLNSLQGEMGTYYVGGIFNFETVEHTSKFAKELVDQVFK
jgi:oxygen-dependent protoporphyrinogen oxidase